MSIGCNCDGDHEYFYYGPSDLEELHTKRSRKCISCGKKIEVGDVCASFARFRVPSCDYEEQRFPDGVPRATGFMCERCGEIYLNLAAFGYCVTLDGNIEDDLKVHWATTGYTPKETPNER